MSSLANKSDSTKLPATVRIQLDVRSDGYMVRLINLSERDAFPLPDTVGFIRNRYSLPDTCEVDERSVDYVRGLGEGEEDNPWGVNEAAVRAREENKGRLMSLSYRTFRIRCN